MKRTARYIDMRSVIGRSLSLKTYTGPRVGLELEYENVTQGIVPVLPKWRTVIDHSLRAGGLEFVSVPLCRKNVPDAIATMLTAARDAGATVTPRCGLHVHLNVSDLTWEDMYKIVVYYTLLEPRLFRTMAHGREDSHFCVPTYSNTTLIEYMHSDGQRLKTGMTATKYSDSAKYDTMVFLKGEMRRLDGLKMLRSPKYAALNMASIKKFGTLEFRQAPSSLNAQFIHKWAEIFMDIRRTAILYNKVEDIIADYSKYGILTLCENVGFKPRGAVDPMDQEDAVDAAVIIAGHAPVKHTDLQWEIK